MPETPSPTATYNPALSGQSAIGDGARLSQRQSRSGVQSGSARATPTAPCRSIAAVARGAQLCERRTGAGQSCLPLDLRLKRSRQEPRSARAGGAVQRGHVRAAAERLRALGSAVHLSAVRQQGRAADRQRRDRRCRALSAAQDGRCDHHALGAGPRAPQRAADGCADLGRGRGAEPGAGAVRRTAGHDDRPQAARGDEGLLRPRGQLAGGHRQDRSRRPRDRGDPHARHAQGRG